MRSQRAREESEGFFDEAWSPPSIFFCFDINHNTLGGFEEPRWVLLFCMVLMDYADSAPAARAFPVARVQPVRNRGEISCTGNTVASQCAPAIEERYAFFLYFGSDDPQYPNGGRAGARGFIITLKRGFLQSRFFFWEPGFCRQKKGFSSPSSRTPSRGRTPSFR
jgi:hypothetical protein